MQINFYYIFIEMILTRINDTFYFPSPHPSLSS